MLIDDLLIWSEEGGLSLTLTVFAVGLSLRLLFFAARLLTNGWASGRFNGLLRMAFHLVRATVPYHRGALKAPFYTGLRYIFHICLFVVPIWYSGHINLWENSSLEWYWTPISDEAVNKMTLVVIFIGTYLLVRRIVWPPARRRSKPADFVVIAIAVLPFLTGYCYTNGTLDHITFFSDYMWYLHVISGEAMLLMMVVMFCVTRLNDADCVGCAACEVSCPTATLESINADGARTFRYSHYQCICCASCVRACPQGAAELRHVIAVTYFFNLFRKRAIRRVPLAACERCGASYGPAPQITWLKEKIELGETSCQATNLCNRCKKIVTARRYLSTKLQQPSKP